MASNSGNAAQVTKDAAMTAAVGYVRTLRPDSVRLEAVADRLCEYGTRHGFTVERVFCDDGPNVAGSLDQSGFLALVSEVRRREVRAVVVPSPAHLSLSPEVRRWMVRMLRHVGAQLVVLPEVAIGVAQVEALCVSDRGQTA